ncbi:MAG: hypothetical protein JRG91_16570 [Deltaproteobacteria bacterium]|nr:hypothetical protein [Deltaproteobacteria bacterium]
MSPRAGTRLVMHACVWAVISCGGAKAPAVKYLPPPNDADPSAECGAWLESFLADPAAAPVTASAKVTFLGIGDGTDPAGTVPAAVKDSGTLTSEPAFDKAIVTPVGLHCSGRIVMHNAGEKGEVWSSTFLAVVDLVWEGITYHASAASIILDSATDESRSMTLDPRIDANKAFSGDFTGEGSELFTFATPALREKTPQKDHFTQFNEILITSESGHLRYYELVLAESEISEQGTTDWTTRGTFSGDKNNAFVKAVDLGLDRTAVMFTWEQSEEIKVALKKGKQPCTFKEKSKKASIRLLEEGSWREIFSHALSVEHLLLSDEKACGPAMDKLSNLTAPRRHHRAPHRRRRKRDRGLRLERRDLRARAVS